MLHPLFVIPSTIVALAILLGVVYFGQNARSLLRGEATGLEEAEVKLSKHRSIRLKWRVPPPQSQADTRPRLVRDEESA